MPGLRNTPFKDTPTISSTFEELLTIENMVWGGRR
jgi:hypothetical protein